MRFKTYLTNLALVLSIAIGLLTATHANANRYVIACDNCDDAAKKQKLQQHLDSGFPQGQYTFFVIDMINGNAREFKADVPYQNFDEFGPWSQPATINQQYRTDQIMLDRSVADVRDSIEQIDGAIDELTGGKIVLPASSGYASAYDALQVLPDFNDQLFAKVNYAETTAEKIRNGKLVLQLLASNIQVGIAAMGAVTINLHRPTTTVVEFADGTTIKVTLSLEQTADLDYEIKVTVDTRAFDKDGNPLPKNKFDLTGYSNGTGGANMSSFISFFNTKGIKVVFTTGTISSGGSCETKWSCSSDGKTCRLTSIGANC